MAGLIFGVVFTLMLALTVFQTQLAENQLDIDRAEDAVARQGKPRGSA